MVLLQRVDEPIQRLRHLTRQIQESLSLLRLM
jgi:hypothetical protein